MQESKSTPKLGARESSTQSYLAHLPQKSKSVDMGYVKNCEQKPRSKLSSLQIPSSSENSNIYEPKFWPVQALKEVDRFRAESNDSSSTSASSVGDSDFASSQHATCLPISHNHKHTRTLTATSMSRENGEYDLLSEEENIEAPKTPSFLRKCANMCSIHSRGSSAGSTISAPQSPRRERVIISQITMRARSTVSQETIDHIGRGFFKEIIHESRRRYSSRIIPPMLRPPSKTRKRVENKVIPYISEVNKILAERNTEVFCTVESEYESVASNHPTYFLEFHTMSSRSSQISSMFFPNSEYDCFSSEEENPRIASKSVYSTCSTSSEYQQPPPMQHQLRKPLEHCNNNTYASSQSTKVPLKVSSKLNNSKESRRASI